MAPNYRLGNLGKYKGQIKVNVMVASSFCPRFFTFYIATCDLLTLLQRMVNPGAYHVARCC